MKLFVAVLHLFTIPTITAFQLPLHKNLFLNTLYNELPKSAEILGETDAASSTANSTSNVFITPESPPKTPSSAQNKELFVISPQASIKSTPQIKGDLFAAPVSRTGTSSISNLNAGVETKRRNNVLIALGSFTLAILNYAYHFTHPLSSLQILSTLQYQSPPLSIVGSNQKPTVVDFWAPWCENCKYFAPTMAQIHSEYGNKVNFIMVNADEPGSWNIIEEFGVDAIPHMAFIDEKGSVETALIGVVSGKAIRMDLDGLIKGEGVPVKGYDFFEGKDRVVKFEEVKR